MSSKTTLTVNFKMFVDRRNVKRAVGKWQHKVLSQTGAFGRTVMQRKLRKPFTSLGAIRSNTVTFIPEGRERYEHIHDPKAGEPMTCWVGPRLVHDTKTGKPVNRFAARRARHLVLKRKSQINARKPPRRGPTDKLHRFLFFGIDRKTQSVVIGPMPFRQQPRMVGAVSVPELLNDGGGEYVKDYYSLTHSDQLATGKDVLVKYYPHPYVDVVMPTVRGRMNTIIKNNPIK